MLKPGEVVYIKTGKGKLRCTVERVVLADEAEPAHSIFELRTPSDAMISRRGGSVLQGAEGSTA